MGFVEDNTHDGLIRHFKSCIYNNIICSNRMMCMWFIQCLCRYCPWISHCPFLPSCQCLQVRLHQSAILPGKSLLSCPPSHIPPMPQGPQNTYGGGRRHCLYPLRVPVWIFSSTLGALILMAGIFVGLHVQLKVVGIFV